MPISRTIRRAALASVFGLAGCTSGTMTGPSSAAGPATIAVPGDPFAALPTADGTHLLVSLSGRGRDAGAIAVLRLPVEPGRPAAIEHLVGIGGEPLGLALSHDGTRLAVADGRATLLLDTARVLSGAGQPVLARFPDEAGAIEVAFSPDDRRLAISEERAARVTLVDPDRPDAAPVAVPVGDAPVGLAFGPAGDFLYAASEIGTDAARSCPAEQRDATVPRGTITTIALRRPGAPAAVATAPVGCAPVRIVLSPDGRFAVITLRGENRVVTVATAELRAGEASRLGDAAVGPSPVGASLSADGRRLVVANSNRFRPAEPGSIACLRVDPAGGLTAGTTLPSGRFPRNTTVLPGGAGTVVTLFESRGLQVVPADCPADGPSEAAAQ